MFKMAPICLGLIERKLASYFRFDHLAPKCLAWWQAKEDSLIFFFRWVIICFVFIEVEVSWSCDFVNFNHFMSFALFVATRLSTFLILDSFGSWARDPSLSSRQTSFEVELDSYFRVTVLKWERANFSKVHRVLKEENWNSLQICVFKKKVWLL